ncbi:hypothetical protein K32_48440 [Kaistia sp. 32K]|nr:hypothetical protein K32_48440 [Kaistia sp. 32K]
MARNPFPTTNALRVLANAYFGLPLAAGAPARGFHAILGSCVQQGTITRAGELTDTGLLILTEYGGKEHGSNR